MAFNPFKTKPPVDKPKRNAFDLSFANNMTMEFGKLYPVFCKECLPGDTFRINPTFGFKFMPMVFPVQSRMRADLKFFYVRNRNLWKNWKKFIGQTDRLGGDSVVPPTLKITDKERLATRSLLDYFGVPSTIVKQSSASQYFSLSTAGQTPSSIVGNVTPAPNSSASFYSTRLSKLAPNNLGIVPFVSTLIDLDADYIDMFTASSLRYFIYSPNILRGKITAETQIQFNVFNFSNFTDFVDAEYKSYILIFKRVDRFKNNNILTTEEKDAIPDIDRYQMNFVAGSDLDFSSGSSGVFASINERWISKKKDGVSVDEVFADYDENVDEYVVAIVLGRQGVDFKSYDAFPVGFTLNNLETIDQREVYDFDSPFYGENPAIPLSALPCRAYEAIYNSFYRNVEIDPFKINGKPEYDVFIPNDDDGADDYPYDFHYANWEHDFLTDALLSPQMGDVTPLVGGRPPEARMYNIVSADGIPYNVLVDQNTQSLVQITPNQNEDLSAALTEAINYGISINDFRNVNALQRWLEKNVRRGYRYKDQMMSHFGVGLTYEECDMPEYIGGISEDVVVRSVTQTTGTSNSPLGAQAGQGAVIGNSKREIDKYTDEHGFVIGILCVTPIPTYSQLLPKFFTKTHSPFEHFTPEFGHIGYQPIPYKEVAPLQVYDEIMNEQAPEDFLERPFGYQRAFYEYLSSTDEVHGEFRNTLKDFLCDRVFQGVPNLSASFLQVRPEQLNDIFANTGNDDKIVGQLWFDCTVVRPIPKFGVPRLE